MFAMISAGQPIPPNAVTYIDDKSMAAMLNKQYGWREVGTPTNTKLWLRYKKAPFIPWGISEDYSNRYPDKLEDVYRTNPYYRRVVGDAANAIAGDELVFEGPDANGLKAFFNRIGVNYSFLERCAFDIALFNGFAYQLQMTEGWVTQPVDASSGVPIVYKVAHQKVGRVRVSRDYDEYYESQYYYTAPDWKAIKTDGKLKTSMPPEMAARKLPRYNPNVPLLARAERAVMLAFNFLYNPATDHYPLPDAESVYEELRLANDIVVFQQRFVENGMVGSAIAYVPWVPKHTAPGEPLSEEDIKDREQKLEMVRNSYTGAAKGGAVAIIMYDPALVPQFGDKAVPRFEKPVETSNDTRFIGIQEQIQQSKLVGLGVVSEELLGIPRPSGFTSQAGMLITADELTYNKIYRPKQDLLLRALNGLAADNGFVSNVGISRTAPVSASRFDASQAPALVAAGVLTVDEFRESYGLPPLTTTATQGADGTDTGGGAGLSSLLKRLGKPPRRKATGVVKVVNFGGNNVQTRVFHA